MTATTKRLTANKHWQQISTGNVTLTGCNTLATYQIYVGADTPTDDSDFISDTLAQTKSYNFDTPVWVKLNVTNTLDEAEVIAIGELASVSNNNDTTAPAPIQNPIPSENVMATDLVFNHFINCEYIDDKVNYTGGILESLGNPAYVATTDRPANIEFVIPNALACNIHIGEYQDYTELGNGNCEGVMLGVGFNRSQYYFDTTVSNIPIAMSIGDKIKISIENGIAHITNMTSGLDFYTPRSTFLEKPKYLGVMVLGQGEDVSATPPEMLIKAI